MSINWIKWEAIWEDGRKEIQLFDTTLRDGHQCPGAAIENDNDYFKVVRWLDKIGFDICEVWFPASSEHEEWRVNQVAQMCRDGEISTMVCWLTQMVDFQVEACLRALEPAMGIKKAMFHIYFPVDPKLNQASIGNKVSSSQSIEDVARFTKMATDMWAVVQFSWEWYSRQKNGGIDNFDFTTDLIIAAAENGATYFNMPDTIWGVDPLSDDEYYVQTIMRHKAIIDEKFPGNDFVWSVHNHNDLWNAVENSIRGVLPGTGISKIEWTVNGIWERAGNADLNQVIARMKTTLGGKFNIDHISAEHIWEVSQLVAALMLPVQPNYPIVGENAMKHTSWGHANAMINNPEVYQPYSPWLIGREISLVYWPNSWWNLAANILEKQWYICGSKEERREFDSYAKAKMQETGRYKWVTDEELLEIYKDFRSPIKISDYGKNKNEWSNEVEVKFEGRIFWEENLVLQWWTVFTALSDYIKTQIPWYKIQDYSSKSWEPWSRSDAITQVIIVHEDTWVQITGIWRDADIETSSLKALANAFNQIFVESNYKATT